jgi:hypothetical protein
MMLKSTFVYYAAVFITISAFGLAANPPSPNPQIDLDLFSRFARIEGGAVTFIVSMTNRDAEPIRVDDNLGVAGGDAPKPGLLPSDYFNDANDIRLGDVHKICVRVETKGSFQPQELPGFVSRILHFDTVPINKMVYYRVDIDANSLPAGINTFVAEMQDAKGQTKALSQRISLEVQHKRPTGSLF